MLTGSAVRRIRFASAYAVGLLAAQGDLPRVPAAIAAMAERPNAVVPTRELAEKLTYLLAWEGERVAGVASYHDRFCYHTMREVREITSIAGSRRAVIDLVAHIKADASALDRTTVGVIDESNLAMAGVLARFGKISSLQAWEG